MPRNGLGLSAADYQDQTPPLDGSPGLNVDARPLANPQVAQVGTLLYGGTPTDGTYSQAWIGPDGTVVTITVVRTGAVPATNADLAAQAALNVAADDAWANVATVTVDGGTPELLNIVWLHAANAYAIGATVVTGPGTLVPAITIAAGGNAIPVGRFLINVANAQDADIPAGGLPLVGTTAPQIIAVNLRDGSVENSGLPGADLIESTPAGQMMSGAHRGPVYFTNHGSVATVGGGPVFAVVNPAGGDAAGEARSDADGGNTVQLTLAQAYWIKAVAPDARGFVYLNGL